MTLAIVILAAGKGTRMNSKTQKILHDVGGKPMVQHVFDAGSAVTNQPPVLVIAPGDTGVMTLFGDRARYVVQEEQLGTGHATMVVEAALKGQSEQVIITYGDMPLLRAETLQNLAGTQKNTGAKISMLSVMGPDDSSFGRVVRGASGQILEIVEVAEARNRSNTAEILAIRELNVGVYCFDAAWLWAHIGELPIRQARSGQEYYLTDMIGLAVAQGEQVEALIIADADECLGAGTRRELIAVEKAFRRRANNHWLENGVTLIDPETIYIDQDVRIGQDTIIWPNTYLQGKTIIGEDCILGPSSIIRDSQIGAGCRVEQAVVEYSTVPEGVTIAPFSTLTGEGRMMEEET